MADATIEKLLRPCCAAHEAFAWQVCSELNRQEGSISEACLPSNHNLVSTVSNSIRLRLLALSVYVTAQQRHLDQEAAIEAAILALRETFAEVQRRDRGGLNG